MSDATVIITEVPVVTVVESEAQEPTVIVDPVLGPTGPGVPSGGDPGEILKKASNEDYDTEWSDLIDGGSF